MTSSEHPLTAVRAHLDQLDDQIEQLAVALTALAERTTSPAGRGTPDDGPPRFAPWLFSSPAAPVEGAEPDLRTTLDDFVDWYNTVYVGRDGTRATAIPPCWPGHPGLAAELATLAHAWLAANTGRTANIHDAQQWHHTWRPGFTDRLTRDWLHPDCLDGTHRPSGSPPSRLAAPSSSTARTLPPRHEP